MNALQRLAKVLQQSNNPAIKAHYAENARQLQRMADKAKATGKKVNGYTFEQLQAKAAEYLGYSK